MKNAMISAIFILAIHVSTQVLAVNTSTVHDHMSMKYGHASASNTNDVKLADGVVTMTDKRSRKITISHGPLPNGMPAMTMAYGVRPGLAGQI
jgi:Cu(I)/Ag(I) efflux system protein CusF